MSRRKRAMPRAAGYHWDAKAMVQAPGGGKSCRWCKGTVPSNRHSWCKTAFAWCLRCTAATPFEPGAEAMPAACGSCGSADVIESGCVHQWTIRTTPKLLRAVVFARDRGVCAACGIDTTPFDLRRINRELSLSIAWYRADKDRRNRMRPQPEKRPDGTPRPPEEWASLFAPAVAWRQDHRVPPDQPPWQMDHIIPVGLGGDWFALRNLQSLCPTCHVAKTTRDTRAIRSIRRARPRATA